MNAEVMKWVGMLLAAGAWFTLVILKMADPDTFVQFCEFSLVGVGAHAMTKGGVVATAASPPPVAVVEKQVGFARPGLLMALALCLYVFLLSACTTVPGIAVTAVKASDDNAIENWKMLACAMPFSAILRHPEIIPSLKSLCLPPAGSAETLLPDKP